MLMELRAESSMVGRLLVKLIFIAKIFASNKSVGGALFNQKINAEMTWNN